MNEYKYANDYTNRLGVLLSDLNILLNKKFYNRIDSSEGVQSIRLRKLNNSYRKIMILLQYGQLSIGNLADKVGIDPKIIGYYVKKLLKLNYVTKEKEDNSKRQVISLTPLGKEVIFENGEFCENVVRGTIESSLSEKDKNDLVSVINNLIDHLDKIK